MNSQQYSELEMQEIMGQSFSSSVSQHSLVMELESSESPTPSQPNTLLTEEKLIELRQHIISSHQAAIQVLNDAHHKEMRVLSELDAGLHDTIQTTKDTHRKWKSLKAQSTTQIQKLMKQHEESQRSLEEQHAGFVKQMTERHNQQMEALKREREESTLTLQLQSSSQINALQTQLTNEKTQMVQSKQKEMEELRLSLEEQHNTQMRANSHLHTQKMSELRQELEAHLADQLSAAYRKHTTEITEIRMESQQKAAEMAQAHSKQIEQLRIQYEKKEGELRRQVEEKTEQLNSQSCQQLRELETKLKSEFGRKESTFQKERELWFLEKESMIVQFKQDRGQMEERIAALEAALAEKQLELSERNEIQRGLAALMDRANHLLVPSASVNPSTTTPQRTTFQRKTTTLNSSANSSAMSTGATLFMSPNRLAEPTVLCDALNKENVMQSPEIVIKPTPNSKNSDKVVIEV